MPEPPAGGADARLSDGAPCGLLILDADGVVVQANARVLDWVGLAPGAAPGRLRFVDLLRGGSRLYYKTHLAPMLRLGRRLDEVMLNLETAAGELIEVMVSATLRDDGCASVVLLPVPKRRRFERQQAEALAAAEARADWLRQVEAMGHVGAWTLDAPDRTLHWSDKVFALHGLPDGAPPDFDGMLAFLDREEMRDRLRGLVERTIAEGHGFEIELDCRTATGQLRRLRYRGEAEWRRGRIERVVGIVRDVTQQHAAETARDLAEGRVSQLAENLPGLLLGLDIGPDGATEVSFISPGCIALLGYRPEEIAADLRLLRPARKRGEPGLLETLHLHGPDAPLPVTRFPILTRAREEKWVELRGSLVRAGAGRLRADCILLDVTAEVAAQTELAMQTTIAQQAQKYESVGQLTGGIAHDFNNLLAVVLGNLQLLRDETGGAEELALIDAAIRATERGAGLTRSLLAFARRARLDPRRVDLNDLVRETRAWTGRTLPAGITVDTVLQRRLWKVAADADAAASALLNLIVNARDAMAGEGRLTIATRNVRVGPADEGDLPRGRYAELSVADTGTGIPSAVLARVFEPFFTTKPPGAGTGLGLSMVHGFMKQTGGTVRVETDPGRGTVFRLYFPVEARRDAAADVETGTAPAGRAARILVVEDEAPVLSVVTALLEKAGHAVVSAASGDSAAALAAEDAGFDLLLTDVVMPGRLQGPDLARLLRRRRPDLPVVFLTGYGTEAVDGFADGDRVLAKPVRRTDLLAAIAAVIAPPDIPQRPAAPPLADPHHGKETSP